MMLTAAVVVSWRQCYFHVLQLPCALQARASAVRQCWCIRRLLLGREGQQQMLLGHPQCQQLRQRRERQPRERRARTARLLLLLLRQTKGGQVRGTPRLGLLFWVSTHSDTTV